MPFAPDDPLTLKEAAEVLLRGIVKESTLRAAAKRGDLVVERLGRATVTTPAAIQAWRNSCRDPAKAHDSGCGQRAGKKIESAPQRGSSKTDNFQSAQAAARLTVKALKEHSKTISPESTASREMAPVIPLKLR